MSRQLAFCVLLAARALAFEPGFGSRRLVQPAPKAPLHGLEALDDNAFLKARHARVAVLAAVGSPPAQQPLRHTLGGLAPDTTLVSRLAFLSAAAGFVRDLLQDAGLFPLPRRRRKRKNDRARDGGRPSTPP